MVPLFADIVLAPGSIVAWIVVGLISGFLAGRFMKGSGFGAIGDIIVGLIGSLIGGFVTGFFVHGDTGFLGSILVSFIGACLFIAILRAIGGRRAA